jgi:ribosome-associated translation inhibitor RaiA
MRIDIQANGFKLTESLLEHTQNRLACDLNWARNHVSCVTVRLSDINGPRGGEDMRALVQVQIPGTQAVVVEDVRTDLYIAIDRAMSRAGKAVARRVTRERDLRQRPHYRPENRLSLQEDDESVAA